MFGGCVTLWFKRWQQAVRVAVLSCGMAVVQCRSANDVGAKNRSQQFRVLKSDDGTIKSELSLHR
jgi:hypothetical protein